MSSLSVSEWGCVMSDDTIKAFTEVVLEKIRVSSNHYIPKSLMDSMSVEFDVRAGMFADRVELSFRGPLYQ